MTAEQPDLCVTMVNEDLRSVPTYPLSPDYRVRWYQPGDEHIWVEIQTAADEYNTITSDLFFQQFSRGTLNLSQRQCYLFDHTARAVATATAWAELDGRYAEYGLVHWMAVIPELQHRGIGKMLMTVICRRLVDLGHGRAFLRTSTLRTEAIALYRGFGFTVISSGKWA